MQKQFFSGVPIEVREFLLRLLKAIIMLMIFLQTLKNDQIRNQKHYAV